MDEKAVITGMNAVKCACVDGTAFIPVTAHMMAKIRTKGSMEYKADCTLGHTICVKLVASKGTVAQLAEQNPFTRK